MSGVRRQRPAGDPRSRGSDVGDGLVIARRAVLCRLARERLPQAAEGAWLGQPVERLDDHGGVTGASQLPTRVAERDALAPVHVVAELVPGDPNERAQPLERLARLVDRLVAILGAAVFERLRRKVQLAAGDAPHALGSSLT